MHVWLLPLCSLAFQIQSWVLPPYFGIQGWLQHHTVIWNQATGCELLLLLSIYCFSHHLIDPSRRRRDFCNCSHIWTSSHLRSRCLVSPQVFATWRSCFILSRMAIPSHISHRWNYLSIWAWLLSTLPQWMGSSNHVAIGEGFVSQEEHDCDAESDTLQAQKFLRFATGSELMPHGQWKIRVHPRFFTSDWINIWH